MVLALLFGIGSALIAKAPTATITATTRVLSSSLWTAEVTEAPAVHPDLLRRDINTGTRTAFLAQTNVCGFLNGALSQCLYLPFLAHAASANCGILVAAAIGCNVGYIAQCGLFVDNTSGSSASEGAMGCCYVSTQGQSTSNCAVFTTCLDYSMLTSTDSCANYCGPNENTLQW